ncbi:neutral zinc metallopeptidase [Nocardia thailandica]|uniref:Neutral zinc metallopeptidase n=1 Tax=Nocardia thailandica TaxID=257275 RepID=A0ABW6PH58_9NOCA
MTQPPYGYGPTGPGGRPIPPRPGYGAPQGPPSYRPGYGAPGYPPQYGHPGYQQPGYPPAGYGQPQGYRPPPMPYGPPGRQPPPRRKRGGGFTAFLLVVLFLVVGGLVRYGVRHGFDLEAGTGGLAPSFTFTPTSGAAAPAETGTNPLLTDSNGALVPASCDYAPWGTAEAKARAFFESAARCLESAWKPLLEKNQLPYQSPALSVTATTDGITTPCTGSTSNFAAFYCAANKTIYMPISQLQTDIFKDNWVVYLSVFAHEFGHHVQAQSGILKKANSDRVDAGVRSAKGLELSRRVELQANCFDGMYIGVSNKAGSLSAGQVTVAKRDAYGRGDGPGDMRDHGSSQHGGEWFELGLDRNRTAQCNTFTASASDVS